MTKCKLIMKDGRSRGIAFVEYDNAESAKKAVNAENGSSHAGREISVEFSGNKKPDGDRPQSGDNADSACLFCGNISFNTSEDSIRDFFASVGDITSVRIAKGDDGRARGFCHIEFGSPAKAQEALKKFNGQELDGRPVRLDISAGRSSGGGRGGFGGGRGRGGFGDRDRGGGRGGFGGGRGFGDRGRGGFRGGDRFGGDRDRRGGFGDRGGFRGRGGDRGGFRKSY